MPTPKYDPPVYDMYLTDQVQDLTKTLNTQRTQSGKIIKKGIKDVKNYIEDYQELSGNSKQTRQYFAMYLDSIAGQIYQGLNTIIKDAETIRNG